MNYKDLPMSLVQRVGYTDAQQYALSTGWQRVPGIKGDIAVYRRPEARRWEIVIPQDRTFADYALRIAEAIATFTEFERLENERRQPLQVLNDLLVPSSDIIRFGLEGTRAEDGSVRLGEAVNLILGGKKALVASACTVVEPQKFHPRMSRSEAEEFINTCRLGQTEQGSYVTTFICPLNALGGDELMLNGGHPQPESFTRQVTRTLLSSVNRVVEAVKADHPENLLNPQEDEPVISANLCEALLDMQPSDDDSLISIYPTWARTVPRPAEAPAKVRLSKEYFPIIEEVARQLRPAQGVREDVFLGWVDALNGKPGPDARPAGDVTLSVAAEDKVIKARIDLPADDYAKAIKAHAKSLLVILRGVLQRERRLSVIRNCNWFEVFDDPNEWRIPNDE